MANYADLNKHIDEKVDITILLDKLSFVEEGVGLAAREQPMLFLISARLRVQKMRVTEQLKAELEMLKAQKSAKARETIAADGERVTEGRVNELVSSSKLVQALETKLRTAKEEEEYAKQILEAYKMRRDALKIVVELLGAEVYVQRKMSGADTEMAEVREELMNKFSKKKKRSA